jgi:mitochondrial fission protein ELM1
MDSVSMVSEAVAGAAPVSVFPLPGKSRRIARFISELEKSGRIRVLTENSPHTKMQSWVVTPLDDTPALVVEMHQRLGF